MEEEVEEQHKPTYGHPCDECQFVGTYKGSHHWIDVYTHKGCSASVIVLVRNGDPENTFGLGYWNFEEERWKHTDSNWPAATWGYKRAKDRGML